MLIYALTIFIGFFAIMNPLANVPIFLELTGDADIKTKKLVALRSLMLAFLIVVIFSVAGKLIFEMFGITMSAFRIAGGLLVVLIGFHMLQGKRSNVHHPSDEDYKIRQEAALSLAIYPLAMPILAGPGTIATAMNFSAHANLMEMVITISAFAVLCVITYFLFVFGGRFVSFIGAGALGIMTRFMGLILAVIGVQMVIDGLHGAFKLSGGS